jgi:hypothetical protein
VTIGLHMFHGWPAAILQYFAAPGDEGIVQKLGRAGAVSRRKVLLENDVEIIPYAVSLHLGPPGFTNGGYIFQISIRLALFLM